MTYEEKMVLFAETVLADVERDRSWYQTPAGHMRTVTDPCFRYSTVLHLLRDAGHLKIDIEEVERRYAERCTASMKVWTEKTYPALPREE